MIIKMGIPTSSDRVRYTVRLQLLLKRLGKLKDVDGTFGPNTDKAVREFQTQMNMVPDGAVGPKTWKALFDAAQPDIKSLNLEAKFFDELRKSLFKKGFTQSQVDGIQNKWASFQEIALNIQEAAYLFATSYHETGVFVRQDGKKVFVRTMNPVEEMLKGQGRRYGKHIKMSGAPYPSTMPIYYGRGDIQLTWYENYEVMGKLLGIDLLNRPDLALVPRISAKILAIGTKKGVFGRKLGSFISLDTGLVDYFNARRCVNVLDKAEEIANFASLFEEALLA